MADEAAASDAPTYGCTCHLTVGPMGCPLHSSNRVPASDAIPILVGPEVTELRVALTEARATIQRLDREVAEQRAELTGHLSEFFNSVPACYDTPVDHYREMARRFHESRDELKHVNRGLEARLRAQQATLQRLVDRWRASRFQRDGQRAEELAAALQPPEPPTP